MPTGEIEMPKGEIDMLQTEIDMLKTEIDMHQTEIEMLQTEKRSLSGGAWVRSLSPAYVSFTRNLHPLPGGATPEP
jgi:hypothetical protein